MPSPAGDTRLISLAISGSPSPASRSGRLLAHAASALAAAGAAASTLELRTLAADDLLGRSRSEAVDVACDAVAAARILVVGTPVYRASYSGLLKVFFDLLAPDAFAGKVAIPIATGGAPGHQLVLDHALRPLLQSLAAVVVTTGVYATDARVSTQGPEPALLARIDRAVAEAVALARVTDRLPASEARMYGMPFDEHDDRYARTSEWLDVVDGLWRQAVFSWRGRFYEVEANVLEPKPLRRPRPPIYAGGESPAARAQLAAKCDAWLTHGDPPDLVGRRVADMRARREAHGLPPMTFGGVGYVVVRPTEAEARREVERITDVRQNARGYANYQEWVANTRLDGQVSLADYSVSNRGLRSGLVGTPWQVADRIAEFERAGLDLMLLQFSPQYEEMERFADTVLPLLDRRRASGPPAPGSTEAPPVQG